MLPKVEAAASFARSRAGREALITVLSKAKEGIEGKPNGDLSVLKAGWVIPSYHFHLSHFQHFFCRFNALMHQHH